VFKLHGDPGAPEPLILRHIVDEGVRRVQQGPRHRELLTDAIWHNETSQQSGPARSPIADDH